jgi:SAM-dependent methyltransferase
VSGPGVYDGAYAERYRSHDDRLAGSRSSMELARWIGEVCDACGRDLTVVDLGCGTGRYFWALRNVRTVVGVDASAPMLAQARRPYRARDIRARHVVLVEADVRSCAFRASTLDLVYSIGVLAEHAPLSSALVKRIAHWLKPGGRFAFTAVRPDSPSVPQTLSRRVATWAVHAAPPPARRALRRRLLSGGYYADEHRVRELLDASFEIESLDAFASEAHLHCRVVARRRAA